MHTLADSEDLEEMPQIAAFHHGLHCLPRQTQSSEKEIQVFEPLHIYTGPFSVYCLFVLLLYCPKSTALVMAGRSVHLTTLFPGQAC